MRINLYTPPDANRVLKGAWIIADRDRAAQTGAYSAVSVGIAYGVEVDYYGAYTGSTTDLKAKLPLRVVTGSQRIALARVVVAEVTRVNRASLVGLSVQIAIGHTLVMPTHRTPDHESHNAVAAMSEFLNNTQAGDQIITVPLWDPASDEAPFQAEDARHAAAVTISATSFTNGNVSVTVTLPSWATKGYVKATAACNFVSTSGAAGSLLYAAIGDGTTDHNEQRETAGVAAALVFDEVFVTFAGEITTTTTFTLRLAVDGAAATASVTNQTLSVFAAFA